MTLSKWVWAIAMAGALLIVAGVLLGSFQELGR